MRTYFKSLTELEEKGFEFLEQEDIAEVKRQLNKNIPLFVSDDIGILRILNEGGIYLAEVKRINEDEEKFGEFGFYGEWIEWEEE